MRYSDCYPGCGGEDCPCCGVHLDHMGEITGAHEPWSDEVPYLLDPEFDGDAPECGYSEDGNHEWFNSRRCGWICRYCGVEMPDPPETEPPAYD